MKNIAELIEELGKERKVTLVTFLLDETGSMESIKGATVDGVNEYLSSLKKDEGDAVLLTLIKWNSERFSPLYEGARIEDTQSLRMEDYVPYAMTPLYDTVGRVIIELDRRLKDTKTKYQMLFVVMTDGHENASKEFTREQVAELISKRRAQNWTFVFLGASEDAWGQGFTLGIVDPSHTSHFTHDRHQTQEAYSALQSASRLYRQTGDFKFESKDSEPQKVESTTGEGWEPDKGEDKK
jgi:hypothetical protein